MTFSGLSVGILGGVAVAGVVTTSNELQERYPAQERHYKMNGQSPKGAVIGSFGGDESVFFDEEGRFRPYGGLDRSRGLFYGNESVAQSYARVKLNPYTVLVISVSGEMPKKEDHVSASGPDLSPHSYLSDEYLRRADVQFAFPRPVTRENREGFFGALWRMGAHYQEVVNTAMQVAALKPQDTTSWLPPPLTDNHYHSKRA